MFVTLNKGKSENYNYLYFPFLVITTLSPAINLKGTATLIISMFYMKELSETWILILVSSKSVEKYGSYGRLNIYKWILMEAAIL